MPTDDKYPLDVPFDYELVCKVVGQLFLETRLRIESLNQQAERLTTERNDLLTLMKKAQRPTPPSEAAE